MSEKQRAKELRKKGYGHRHAVNKPVFRLPGPLPPPMPPQEVDQRIKEMKTKQPLQFINFRD